MEQRVGTILIAYWYHIDIILGFQKAKKRQKQNENGQDLSIRKKQGGHPLKTIKNQPENQKSNIKENPEVYPKVSKKIRHLSV